MPLDERVRRTAKKRWQLAELERRVKWEASPFTWWIGGHGAPAISIYYSRPKAERYRLLFELAYRDKTQGLGLENHVLLQIESHGEVLRQSLHGFSGAAVALWRLIGEPSLDEAVRHYAEAHKYRLQGIGASLTSDQWVSWNKASQPSSVPELNPLSLQRSVQGSKEYWACKLQVANIFPCSDVRGLHNSSRLDIVAYSLSLREALLSFSILCCEARFALS